MTDNPTLETLESKLQRLIEEWKNADALYVNSNAPEVEMEIKRKANFNLAEFVVFHPELLTTQPSVYYSPDGLEGALIPQLLALPDEIKRLQEAYDEVDRDYQALAAINSLDALTNTLFKDKGDTSRPANNEREREIAINYSMLGNAVMEEVWSRRADALRALTQAKNRLECARLIIQMINRGNGK